MKIDVALLPRDIALPDLADTVCIVLDIFRATSCITTAIANGCQTIIPVLSMEEAQKAAAQAGPALLAGERQSVKIAGCDIGNSPFEFSREKVAGKTVIMNTSNGTVAIKAVDGAYRTLIGSFLNAGAVCRKAAQYGKEVLIVCAGTDRLFSLEDTLCAGLLVQLLSEGGGTELTDSAQAALLLYGAAQDKLTETAVRSRNGKRLADLGRLEDVRYCLQIDLLQVVPQYQSGRIDG